TTTACSWRRRSALDSAWASCSDCSGPGRETGVLRVRRQWTRSSEYAQPKTPSAIRDVPLTKEMVAKLVERKLATDYSGNEPVFASATGRPLNHRNVA